MKKVLLSMLLMGEIISMCPNIPVHASEISSTYYLEEIDVGDGNVARADVIEIKYRTYNGVLQYRRWNASRNVWVDPYWMDY